jgi:hypothetical protein
VLCGEGLTSFFLHGVDGSSGGVKAPTIREESNAVDAEAICVAVTTANMRFNGIEHGT